MSVSNLQINDKDSNDLDATQPSGGRPQQLSDKNGTGEEEIDAKEGGSNQLGLEGAVSSSSGNVDALPAGSRITFEQQSHVESRSNIHLSPDNKSSERLLHKFSGKTESENETGQLKTDWRKASLEFWAHQPVTSSANFGSHPLSRPLSEEDQFLIEWEKYHEEERHRKPMWFAVIITEYPKMSMIVVLALHLMMVVATVVLMAAGVDVIPTVFDRLPLEIRNDEDFLRGLAWDYREDTYDIIDRGQSDLSVQRERSKPTERVVFMYELLGGNILTKENLQIIAQVETSFVTEDTFVAEFCYEVQAGMCSPPTSLIRLFDGSYANIDPVFNDPTYLNIVGVMSAANTHNLTKPLLQFALGKNSTISKTEAVAEIVRSYFSFGIPLKGYDNNKDDEDGQMKKIETYLYDNVKNQAEKYFSQKVGKMSFYYSSELLFSLTIADLVVKDLYLVAGSISFVFVFMWIQTRSLWVTSLGLFSVLCSFCEANIIYRFVLDYRYFGVFQVLALFIIVGIGADDFFVYFDTWKEAGHYSFDSLAHRVSFTYRRAALAMFYTSITTAVAFIVSASSPFLAVRSFGVFAGTLVLVNYVSVIIYFPVVIVIYHIYFNKFKCCCCFPTHKVTASDVSMAQDSTEIADHMERKHILVRFFSGPYHKFATHSGNKYIILLVFIMLIILSALSASRIEVNQEQTKFLPDQSNFGRFLDRQLDFSTADEPVQVFIVFGLKEQDLSSCHKTDALCTGRTVWDNSFDLSNATAQQGIMKMCQDLKDLPQSKRDEMKIRNNIVTKEAEVQCFISDMVEWLQEEESRETDEGRKYPSGSNLSIPFNSQDVQLITTHNVHIYENISKNFDHNFELVMSFWLFNGFQEEVGLGSQFSLYNEILGEVETSKTQSVLYKDNKGVSYIYKYGTRIKFAAIVINTTIQDIGYIKGLPVRDAWEDWVDSALKDQPAELQGGFQMTPQIGAYNIWHWFKIQKLLVTSAIIGIVSGLSLAFPILVFATHNIVTGLLATFTICCITLSMVAIIPLAGWKIGLLESLNIVLVVGLAVDYCVHLAEGYSRSFHRRRVQRVHDTLQEVGISVLSGACTTLGASSFLLFAHILFFTQFGMFMFCTIGFSIIYALGFFVTVLATVGPEEHFGSFRPFLRRACKTKEKKKPSNREMAEDEVQTVYVSKSNVNS